MGLSSSILFYTLILCFFLNTVSSVDLINSNETLRDGMILVSSNQRFVLGFFIPAASSTSNNTRYLGIWYKSSPEIVIWVANRETPLTDSNGVLLTWVDGNLALINGVNQIVWSTNYSIPAEQEGSVTVAQLLNSGNFVVRKIGDKDTQSYIWQSFDFPTNTLLPGMKVGFNSSIGRTWSLGSWKNKTDPSSGEFTFSMDSKFGLPRFVLLKGSFKRYQSGGWNGIRFSGTNALSNSILQSTLVYDNQGSYYSYQWADNTSTSRLVLTESGLVERYLQNEGSSDWSLMYAVPKDLCDDYGRCGANGICRISKTPICDCLEGFFPRSIREWDMLNWSSGCARKTPLDCRNNGEDDEFLRVKNVELPDLTEFQLRRNMSLEECKTRCLMNCSCTAYAYSDITAGGCSMWYGDLIDLREFIPDQSEQDIYIRMPVSELGNNLGPVGSLDITMNLKLNLT